MKVLISIVAIFFLSLSFGYVVNQQTQFPISQQASDQNNPVDIPKKIIEIKPMNDSADNRIATYTLWLMLFTGVLAVSTILLWFETRSTGKTSEIAANAAKASAKATERSVEIMDDAANKQLRAYLGIAGITINSKNIYMMNKKIEDNSDLSHEDKIIFNIKNYGLTPANGMVVTTKAIPR